MDTTYNPVAMDDSSSSEKPTPKPNVFVRNVRKIYNPLGFKKGYNFTFFFITAGALLGFCLYNIRVVDVDGYWSTVAAPGEWYYFSMRRYNIGMKIHLISIIPAGILVVLQFFPIIRYKAIMVHRFNGWLVTLLLLVSNASALMIADRSFGGRFETQVFVGVLAVFTTVAAVMGIINIKLKQIDQHRKWMVRCWVYCGCIVTLRLVQIIGVLIMAGIGGFYVAMDCNQVDFIADNSTYSSANYPSCAAGTGTGYTAVVANFNSEERTEELAASLQMAFGPSGLIAFLIHLVLVEIYFHLTPKESERLRTVAYTKQLERGHKHPGSSGTTSDRFGDAERWTSTLVGDLSTLRPGLAQATNSLQKVPTVGH